QRQFNTEQPTIQLPLDQDTAKLAGVPQQFVGKNLSPADWKLVDGILQSKGYSRFDKGFDGPRGGIWVVDKAGNEIHQMTTISESRRILAAQSQANAAAKTDRKAVMGTEPATGRTILVPEGQAKTLGLQNVMDAPSDTQN